MKEVIIVILSAISSGGFIAFFFKRHDQKKDRERGKLNIILKELCDYNLVIMDAMQTYLGLLSYTNSNLAKLTDSEESIHANRKAFKANLVKLKRIKAECEQGEQHCDECNDLYDNLEKNETVLKDWEVNYDIIKQKREQRNKETAELLLNKIKPFSSLLNKIPELYEVKKTHLYNLAGQIDVLTTKIVAQLILIIDQPDNEKIIEPTSVLTEQILLIENAKLEISNALK